jgi:hypothetical protein
MIPWWQSVLGGAGGVLAAIIAGSFAVRNARKTPHETLKTLVEIAEKLEGHIQPQDRAVLDAAVRREIARIYRLNQARLEGFWKYWIERGRQTVSFGPIEISLVKVPQNSQS